MAGTSMFKALAAAWACTLTASALPQQPADEALMPCGEAYYYSDRVRLVTIHAASTPEY